MKATLEFDLDDRDDATAHLRCVKSLDMASAIFELLRNTRKSWEWKFTEDDNKVWDANDMLDAIWEDIWNKFEGINIDDLII